MRVARSILVVALLSGGATVGSAQKPQLPEERHGTDPKPDTDAALSAYARGNFDRAIQQAKLALSRDEKHVPAMMVLAKSYFRQQKLELAQAIIREAQLIDKNNAEAHNLLGFISLQKDDRIAATAEFKKATELDANFATAWDNLAAQYLFAKNYDGALEAAQRATQLRPNVAKAWLNLGSAQRGKSAYTESEQSYKKALELDPGNADAYFNLGILFLDAKEFPGLDTIAKYNQAISYLNRYQQLAGARLSKDDPAAQYVADARKAIDKEQKRLDRERKKREKAAAAAAAGKTPEKTEGK